jgi:putative membrane protein
VAKRRYRAPVPLICFGTFAVIWVALAIQPRYPADWLLENLPTFFLVPLAVLTYPRFRFSDGAYIQATIFAVLHTIGSHYTYSEVPAGEWMRDAFGLSRNHYDRFVHFAFGVLLLRPARELVIRKPGAVGPIAVRFLSFAAVGFCSLSYEIIEWLVASVADPAAGTAFLGTQGDVWDAQKDMALACLGAGIGLLLDRRPYSRG